MLGNKYMLKAIEPEVHARFVKQWIQDTDITKYMVYGQRPQTLEHIRQWLESDSSSNNDVFIISCVNANAQIELIGFTGLYSISQTSQSAELRILIGDHTYLGIGVGPEIVMTLLAYAFDRLNLNSVWLGVVEKNEAAMKCYKRCGFIEQGKRRAAVYRNGEYYDVVWMDIMRSEYEHNLGT